MPSRSLRRSGVRSLLCDLRDGVSLGIGSPRCLPSIRKSELNSDPGSSGGCNCGLGGVLRKSCSASGLPQLTCDPKPTAKAGDRHAHGYWYISRKTPRQLQSPSAVSLVSAFVTASTMVLTGVAQPHYAVPHINDSTSIAPLAEIKKSV